MWRGNRLHVYIGSTWYYLGIPLSTILDIVTRQILVDNALQKSIAIYVGM